MTEPLVPPTLQWFATAVLVAFLLAVLRLVRAQRLSLRDSLLWLLSTAAVLVATLAPWTLQGVARLLHIAVPSNALFAFALLYVVLNLLSTTIAVSSNAARVRRLAQECALLRGDVDHLRRALEAREPGPAR